MENQQENQEKTSNNIIDALYHMWFKAQRESKSKSISPYASNIKSQKQLHSFYHININLEKKKS